MRAIGIRTSGCRMVDADPRDNGGGPPICGQSYKHSTIINYDCRVILTANF